MFALSTTAVAHSGHADGSVWQDLLHPLTGLDHVLVLLAVGGYCIAALPQTWWRLPIALTVAMGAAAAVAASSHAMPGMRLWIAAAVLAMVVLLVLRRRAQRRRPRPRAGSPSVHRP